MRVFRLLRGRQGWVAVMVVLLTVGCGSFVTFLSVMDLSVSPPDPVLVACYGDDPNSIMPNGFANFFSFQQAADLVVCAAPEQTNVLLETCQFDGVTVERYAYEVEIWLVNQSTQVEIARGPVRGLEPPSCQASLSLVSAGSSGVSVQGQPVSAPDIEAWLAPYFPETEQPVTNVE